MPIPKLLVRSHKVYGPAVAGFNAISVFEESKKSGSVEIATDSMTINSPEIGSGVKLDFAQWLPFAAPHYEISADPKDYVIKPVIVMPSDLPNRNGVAFPLKELIKFQPDFGMQSYKTWKGKPTFYEHQNKDISKAYGVIVDAHIAPMKGWASNKLWKVMLLLAFDRSKHADVASRVASGDLNSFSMGAMVGAYHCSLCDAELGKCKHLKEKEEGIQFYEHGGELAFKNVREVVGFETSAVETPAYISAISDTTLHLNHS